MLWTHHHVGSWCNRNSISRCKMSPCSNCKAFSLFDLRGPISGNQEALRDDTFEPGGPPHFGTGQVPKCQYPLLPARPNLSVKSHGLVIVPRARLCSLNSRCVAQLPHKALTTTD